MAAIVETIYTAMSKNPLYFAKKVAPSYFTMDFGVFQKDMINEIKKSKNDIITISVARGYGKTILLSTAYVLWSIMFHRKKYVVIASFSDRKAMQILSDIKNIVEGDAFKRYFGNCRGDEWSSHTMKLQNESWGIDALIMSRGIDSQMTGLRYKAYRPQLFILDDLEDPDQSYNQEIVDRNERKILEVIKPAMAVGGSHERGKILYIGTPFFYDCTLTRLMKLKKGSTILKYPALVDDYKLSAKLGVDMWKSIWEEHPSWNTEAVNKIKQEYVENGHLDIFLRQYMLDARPQGSIRFEMDKLNYYDIGDIKGKVFKKFLTCDLAYKKKKTSDKTAIIICGWTVNKEIYVLDCISGKFGDVESISLIMDQVMKYGSDIERIGIESYAWGFIKEMVYNKMNSNNLNASISELKPNGRRKEDRIKALIPIIEMGKLYIREDMKELLNQMIRFDGNPKNSGDDILDALAYQLDIGYQPEFNDKNEEENESNNIAWAKLMSEYEEESKGFDIRYRYGSEYADDILY